MDEFWVCAHCRSLNRAGTGKCYSCREKYGSVPKGPAPVKPAPTPPLPTPKLPAFGASPTPPPAYSRPVALPPAPRMADSSFTRSTVAPAAVPGYRFPSPVAAIKGRIARSLAMRQSVPVGWLGYLTAILIFLVLAAAAIVAVTVVPFASDLLQNGHLGSAWAQMSPGQQELARSELVFTIVLAALTLLSFSVFVGLSTNNATGLGAEQPLLDPYRAGKCWTGAVWTQTRIAVGLIVPALLLWRGYFIPGLIAGVVATEIAHRHLEGDGGWLSRPAQHLPDLYAKLGIEGNIASPLAWAWSGSFRVANAMAVAVSAIPALGFVLFCVAAMTGRSDLFGWHSNGLGAGQITAALLVVSFVGWAAVSLALLIPITLGLVQRQRTRKTLVRVGKARSWAARPGQRGQTAPNQTAASDFGGYDEDRIVERVAGSMPEAPAADGPVGGFGTGPGGGLGGGLGTGPGGGLSAGPGGSAFGRGPGGFGPAEPAADGSIFTRPGASFLSGGALGSSAFGAPATTNPPIGQPSSRFDDPAAADDDQLIGGPGGGSTGSDGGSRES